ncbi:UDP-glucose/GDP-mannose dehydrogenase family protein [bacterium NHP-B]|nr:UDP-glucose/GDP-mannose dehydrogenase family protein [bacterium NHP-B]
MHIAVVGTGYVGLISGACFASFGHHVTCIDKNVDVIQRLNRGGLPFFEPDLKKLLHTDIVKTHLSFSHETTCVAHADAVFLAVGTPETPTGDADVSAVFLVVEDLAAQLKKGARIVLKSTVPIGTNKRVHNALARLGRPDVGVISNPEFLREGSAIPDFMKPDRLVVGVRVSEDETLMRQLYQPLLDQNVPFLATEPETAETIKYAANSFLAMKITFINQVADLCEQTGGNVEDVAQGIGLDHRINPYFLKPGPGFGGSCFPKDTRALEATAQKCGVDLSLVRTAIEANTRRKEAMGKRIVSYMNHNVRGKTIAAWGITFKANTDDLRESPAMTILSYLEKQGARLALFDPQAKKNLENQFDALTVCADPYEAAHGADALVILTEWPLFQNADLDRLKHTLAHPRIIDLRNLYQAPLMKEKGFFYVPIGQPARS